MIKSTPRDRDHAHPATGPIPAAAGIGLRFPHHRHVLGTRPPTAWFEVHPENYLHDARALRDLESIRRDYPLSLHAVGLSLGSAAGVDAAHLQRVATLVHDLAAGLVSDHLSWSVANGIYLPDLLPLPYTEEALGVVCRNVEHVQAALGRTILIENPSTYLRYAHSTLPEAVFLAEVARRTGCGVLFDVNNVYVSARNHGEDPSAALRGFLEALPAEAIGELHVAGHALVTLPEGGEVRIDDHGAPVDAAVWGLFAETIARLGPKPVLIEWDTRIPQFAALEDEARRAQRLLGRCLV